jgi:hypothetical protein
MNEAKLIDTAAAGHILRHIRNTQAKAAKKLFEAAGQLADYNCELNELKRELALSEAKVRVEVSTKANPQTGKLFYQNIDSQNAAVIVELGSDQKHEQKLSEKAGLELEIEKIKAKILYLHEWRRDLRTEADLQQAAWRVET